MNNILRIKTFNECYSSDLDRKVNDFLQSLKASQFVDIKYKTTATNHTAWNCVIIIYREE